MDRKLPEGFVYQAGFISVEEEQNLIREITQLEFSSVVMHGIAARRRVAHFGLLYQFASHGVAQGPPVPDFLEPFRTRAAALIDVVAADLGEVLITEYPPGAGIGWHRDAAPFGRIIGISLLSSCRLRFRRLGDSARNSADVDLEPRSAYVIRGEARAAWQHHIPAVNVLRYSITFRTLRPQKGEK